MATLVSWMMRNLSCQQSLLVDSIFSREPLAMNSHHNAQGLLAHPIDGHDVLKLDLLHFGCFLNEAIYIRAMESGEQDTDKGTHQLLEPPAEYTN